MSRAEARMSLYCMVVVLFIDPIWVMTGWLVVIDT